MVHDGFSLLGSINRLSCKLPYDNEPFVGGRTEERKKAVAEGDRLLMRGAGNGPFRGGAKHDVTGPFAGAPAPARGAGGCVCFRRNGYSSENTT